MIPKSSYFYHYLRTIRSVADSRQLHNQLSVVSLFLVTNAQPTHTTQCTETEGVVDVDLMLVV